MYDLSEILAPGGPLDALADRLAGLCGPAADRDDLAQTARLAVWAWSRSQPTPDRVDLTAALAVAKAAVGGEVRRSQSRPWPRTERGGEVDLPAEPARPLPPALGRRLARFRRSLAAVVEPAELEALEEVYCWGRSDPADPAGWRRFARRMGVTPDEAVGLLVTGRAKAAARLDPATVEALFAALADAAADPDPPAG